MVSGSAVLKKFPLLLLCLILGALIPPGVKAQETLTQEINADTRSILEEVLLSPDFGGEKPGWGIRFKPRLRNDYEPALPHISWMTGITRAFAWGLRFLLVSGILALGVFLFLRFRKQSREKSPGLAQSFFSGGEKESPELLLEKARVFHREGKIREAWACCFSAACTAFSQYQGLCFPPDATEYDCLALAAGAPGFAALVTTWVGFAYGGKIPPEGAFSRALDFCCSLLNPPVNLGVPPPVSGKNHG
jgi:hypothetical protein